MSHFYLQNDKNTMHKKIKKKKKKKKKKKRKTDPWPCLTFFFSFLFSFLDFYVYFCHFEGKKGYIQPNSRSIVYINQIKRL